jgi:HK97 family phage prohead protease
MSDLRPMEYGAGGGYITHVDRKQISDVPSRKTAGNSRKVAEGDACIYNKPHLHRGRIEVFDPGCFALTLASDHKVRFYIDHDYSNPPLGDSGNELELINTKVGLSFRLRTSPENLMRLQGRTGMSVGYLEREVEVRQIEGENVRFIKRAALFEISACHKGAIKETHLIERSEDDVGSLRRDVEFKFPNDSAYVALRRALERLS